MSDYMRGLLIGQSVMALAYCLTKLLMARGLI